MVLDGGLADAAREGGFEATLDVGLDVALEGGLAAGLEAGFVARDAGFSAGLEGCFSAALDAGFSIALDAGLAYVVLLPRSKMDESRKLTFLARGGAASPSSAPLAAGSVAASASFSAAFLFLPRAEAFDFSFTSGSASVVCSASPLASVSLVFFARGLVAFFIVAGAGSAGLGISRMRADRRGATVESSAVAALRGII